MTAEQKTQRGDNEVKYMGHCDNEIQKYQIHRSIGRHKS